MPLEVFHDEEIEPVLLDDFVGMDDVAVIQPGGDTRFVEEHRDEVLIPRKLGTDLFDHDELVEARRPAREREVHPCHAPLRQEGDQLVAANSSRFGLNHAHCTIYFGVERGVGSIEV